MPDKLPETEALHPRSGDLDVLSTEALVALLIEENRDAVTAVLDAQAAIASVADRVADKLRCGGTLHYIGAGTSGRLAYLDASELVPTFGISPNVVRAHIAGGETALTRAVEGAEDDGEAGKHEIIAAGVTQHDVVIGISASGSARFVIEALRAATERGALTVAICNAAETALAEIANTCILLRTGAEVLAGSTRLKAGTAQKITLNSLSTAVMVRLGKVRGNRMIDLIATNEKLRHRAVRIVMELRRCSADEARALLAQNDWSVRACLP